MTTAEALPETFEYDELYIDNVDQDNVEFRGQGLSRFIFGKFRDFAADIGCSELTTVAANERTAKLFDVFDPEDLSFYYLRKPKGGYSPLKADIGSIISFLGMYRELVQKMPQPKQLNYGFKIAAKL